MVIEGGKLKSIYDIRSNYDIDLVKEFINDLKLGDGDLIDG